MTSLDLDFGEYIERDGRSVIVDIDILDGLIRSAERYRWLRDNGHLNQFWSVAGPADKSANIDADIDEAMSADHNSASASQCTATSLPSAEPDAEV